MPAPCRVFLLEDNGDDIFFIKQALAQLKIPDSLICVRDGQEAMDYLSGAGNYKDRTQYPLPTHVLLDLKVPRKSGLQLLEWMRDRPDFAELPVIVFTSSRDRSDIEKAKALKIDAYLVKPVAFKDLVVSIDAVRRFWSGDAKDALELLDVLYQ